jgi:hypothetical protein
MTNFLIKHFRTLAITSVTLTSSYFLVHYDQTKRNHLFKVKAAEYVNENKSFVLIRNKKFYF